MCESLNFDFRLSSHTKWNPMALVIRLLLGSMVCPLYYKTVYIPSSQMNLPAMMAKCLVKCYLDSLCPARIFEK